MDAALDVGTLLDVGDMRDVGDAPDAGLPLYRGRISLMAGGTDYAGAAFYGADGTFNGATNRRCEVEDAPPGCVVLRCVDSAAFSSPEAGLITLALSSGDPGTLTPNATGVYTGAPPDWTSGSEVTVSGAGGDDVPAFATTVRFPGSALLATLPAGPVLRSEALTFTWTPRSDEVRASVLSATTNGTIELVCVFDGSSGSGAMPSTLVATLPTGDALLSLLAVDTSQVVVGDYHVHVTAAYRDGDATTTVDVE